MPTDNQSGKPTENQNLRHAADQEAFDNYVKDFEHRQLGGNSTSYPTNLPTSMPSDMPSKAPTNNNTLIGGETSNHNPASDYSTAEKAGIFVGLIAFLAGATAAIRTIFKARNEVTQTPPTSIIPTATSKAKIQPTQTTSDNRLL